METDPSEPQLPLLSWIQSRYELYINPFHPGTTVRTDTHLLSQKLSSILNFGTDSSVIYLVGSFVPIHCLYLLY